MPRTNTEIDRDLEATKTTLQQLDKTSARLEQGVESIERELNYRVSPLKERLDRIEPEVARLREDHARLDTEFRELKRTLEEDRKQRRALWITLFVVFLTAVIGLGKDWIGKTIAGARNPSRGPNDASGPPR